MIISTSTQLQKAVADPAAALSGGSLTVHAKAATPEAAPAAGMMLGEAAAANGLRQVSFNLTYQPGDPEALKLAVGQLEGLTRTLAARAEAAEPSKPLSYVKVGSAAGVGAVTGMGVGVLLSEMGKLGAQSGNPFLNAASIACALIGAAAGAGVSTGVVQIDFDKFGVKAKVT